MKTLEQEKQWEMGVNDSDGTDYRATQILDRLQA